MKKNKKTLEALFLTLFILATLIVGCAIVKDYGVSWDEFARRNHGQSTWFYVTLGERGFLSSASRTHGVFFEWALIFLEKGIGLGENLYDVYMLRHSGIFVFFVIGLIGMFLLTKKVCRDWRWGLVGSVFLCVSPRIFAHAFYNSKDIPFLVMCIFSMLTLITFVDRPRWRSALVHGVVCGVAISIRVIGCVFVPLTIALYVLQHLWCREKRAESWNVISLYVGVTAVITLLCWPLLWRHPIAYFVNAVIEMLSYQKSGEGIQYLGREITSTTLPWNYVLVWIGVTTPPLYLIGMCIGVVRVFFLNLFSRATGIWQHKNSILVLLWFLGPVSVFVVCAVPIYNGWRHLYFMYPAIIVLAVLGFQWSLELLNRIRAGLGSWCVSCALFVSVLYIIGEMFVLHPYQGEYFNRFAGDDSAVIEKQFNVDYWGLAYREALEYVVDDASGAIAIHVQHFPGEINRIMLSEAERSRLQYVDDWRNADYLIGNSVSEFDQCEGFEEVYVVTARKLRLLFVYKKNRQVL